MPYKAGLKKGLKDNFANVKNFASTTSVTKTEGWEGYTLSLGATAPVAGGTFYAQANYLDSESSSKNNNFKTTYTYDYVEKGVVASLEDKDAYSLEKLEAKNWGIAVGYAYPFSKRTNVYTFASYNELKLTASYSGEHDSAKTKVTEFGIGLKHSF